MNDAPLTLYQLLNRTKTALKSAMPASCWILAEISEMKVNYSGHCYLELIEKEEDNDQIRAKARATIWSATFRMLKPYFETTTHAELRSGLKILVRVTVEFHEIYGFSLNINDIEPSYTIGEMARQKQEIINRLISEGVFEMNRKLPFPDIPKTIAVISSKTAAGYGDFMDQILDNPFGYGFHIKLFPAVMQGDDAEKSIVKALERIFAYADFFDVVVIIRGGGAQSELNCFNNYWIASHVCQFPLPVLTGIGHEQDETIADLVAHTHLKTPTAVAEYLISRFRAADERINELTAQFSESLAAKLGSERDRLNRYMMTFKPAIREKIFGHAAYIRNLQLSMAGSSRQMISKHSIRIGKFSGRIRTNLKGLFLGLAYRQLELKTRLTSAGKNILNVHSQLLRLHEEKNRVLDPFKVLERGYSITYHNGKALRNNEGIRSGALLETRLHKGRLKSKTI
ncbi:MAG: exodeoxyribonuclease VII large subunit [Bacteroidales bacterium]|nr:exodeoxyribonuclease VII large subunit [Bacteroidales bacterium]